MQKLPWDIKRKRNRNIAYSFTDALFFTANTFLDKSIKSRDKWVQIGSKTFGALGGFWISLALGALTVETGPGVIIGIAAGFIYDAYEAYRFATYINNINNNTLIYRSFSNYQTTWTYYFSFTT